MTRKIELLAPGGDIESIKAAIVAGADAIYCGLNNFNARNRATNIAFAELNGILLVAHRNNCKIYLTINIIIVESEIRALVNLLNRLVNTSIDGIIVQDLGLFYLLSNYFKTLEIHASTQLTTHNEGQIKFLGKLNATQVNLSRELCLAEIKTLTAAGHKNNIRSEVFVHGSNCLSFSGICYISSVLEGKSGNRGRCSQPCRDQYLTTPEGKDFPLNLKDNSAYLDLPELAAAGVDSLKIEGRIKKFHYVYTVVNAWRKQLDRFYAKSRLDNDYSPLNKVFNRDLTNSFLKGDLNKDLYIDNPRDNSARHLSAMHGDTSEAGLTRYKQQLHDLRTDIITQVKNKIKPLRIEKAPLSLSISGKAGTPLTIAIKTTYSSFVVSSQTMLKTAGKGLDLDTLAKKFKPLNDTEYCLRQIEADGLQSGLHIASKELTSLRKQILFVLNGAKETIEPIEVPRLKQPSTDKIKPTLAVLISSREDLHLGEETAADIYFQLPSCFENDYSGFIELFLNNTALTPWFPSVLIGKDYTAAVDILQQVQPELIVTNNTGIAYAAGKMGIPWIAGPHLNTVNSFSMLGLKERLNCCGAFISNEISKKQIKSIRNPGEFKFYYSIYHPILLLTSRQCLFHQIVGCEKSTIDETCLQNCSKSTSITSMKHIPLLVDKTSGDYHCIYNNINFLNTEIVSGIPDTFSSFFIDLRDIKTETKAELAKSGIIRMFEQLLNGNPAAKKELEQLIHPVTNAQYQNGI